MKLQLPFVSRRVHAAVLAEAAGLRLRVAETEKRHDEAEGERRYAVDELAAVSIVNVRLTEDLAQARAVLAETVASDKTSIDLAAALERAELLQAELDDARLVASRLTALVESRQQLDDQQRPIDAAAPVRREAVSARLRRERERVRKLEEIVRELQASHVADTRELHDLRQGAAS